MGKLSESHKAKNHRGCCSLYHNSLILLLFSMGIIVFILGCAGPAQDTQQNSQQSPTKKMSFGRSSTSQNTYIVGETFNIGDLQYIINKVCTNNCVANKTNPPKEGNTYLFVDLSIENLGRVDNEVRSMTGFQLNDREGSRQPFSIGALLAVKDDLDRTIPPGGKIHGQLGYEVSKEAQTYELVIKPNPFSTKTARVEITME